MSQEKLKILIVMAGFLPAKRYGGPPISVNNFCDSISKIADCYIITRNKESRDTKPLEVVKGCWNERSNCKVYYLSDNEGTYSKLNSLIECISPNLIYIQSLFAIPKITLACLKIAKKRNIRRLLTPRGELCEGALKIHKNRKILYIWMLHKFGFTDKLYYHATSSEELSAINHYMKSELNSMVNLPNIPSVIQGLDYKKLKNPGEIRVIFLSRIVSKKNLAGALKLLKNVSGKVQFDIYGYKEDPTYWVLCEKIISSLPSNVTATYKGLVDYSDVHKTFSQYEVFLFPTFSENYGHVIAESLSAGCPIIISDQTPWTDINQNNVGWAIPLNNEKKFEEAIQHVINMDNNEYSELVDRAIKYAKEKLNIDEIRHRYIQTFNELLHRVD